MIYRNLLAPAFLALAACTSAVQAATFTMFSDPSCGCCEHWADHVRDELETEITKQVTADMAAVKMERGIPRELWSCHTMIVDGYVIEGHVPAAEIARLLEERPEGVKGLAVPGMPIGSPGMEMAGRQQPYQVVAFGDAGMTVFASYN